MTVTLDYQAELGGVLMGPETDFVIIPPGISGLGIAKPKTQDVDLAGADGVYPGADFRAPRIILIPLEILGDDDDDAMGNYHALELAWLPTVATTELHIKLPALGAFYFVGKARGIELNLELLARGVVQCVAEFHATDPTRHT